MQAKRRAAMPVKASGPDGTLAHSPFHPQYQPFLRVKQITIKLSPANRSLFEGETYD